MTDSTDSLVAQLVSGDRRGIPALLQAFLPELHAFIRLRMGPALMARETTEDLAQSLCREVLEEEVDGGFEYRGELEFKRWLFLRAQNKVVDRARFHTRDRRDAGREVAALPLDDWQFASGYRSLITPSRAAIQTEEVERLEGAFDAMPDDYREVISLAKVLELPHKEIAERMGRSEAATRVLLHRAMIRLAFLLDEE